MRVIFITIVTFFINVGLTVCVVKLKRLNNLEKTFMELNKRCLQLTGVANDEYLWQIEAEFKTEIYLLKEAVIRLREIYQARLDRAEEYHKTFLKERLIDSEQIYLIKEKEATEFIIENNRLKTVLAKLEVINDKYNITVKNKNKLIKRLKVQMELSETKIHDLEREIKVSLLTIAMIVFLAGLWFCIALVHSGIDERQANSFLSELNIPTFSHKLIGMILVGNDVEEVSKESTDEVWEKESVAELENKSKHIVSVDAGWQRRGSCRSYDRYYFMLNPETGTIIIYSVISKEFKVKNVMGRTPCYSSQRLPSLREYQRIKQSALATSKEFKRKRREKKAKMHHKLASIEGRDGVSYQKVSTLQAEISKDILSVSAPVGTQPYLHVDTKTMKDSSLIYVYAETTGFEKEGTEDQGEAKTIVTSDIDVAICIQDNVKPLNNPHEMRGPFKQLCSTWTEINDSKNREFKRILYVLRWHR